MLLALGADTDFIDSRVQKLQFGWQECHIQWQGQDLFVTPDIVVSFCSIFRINITTSPLCLFYYNLEVKLFRGSLKIKYKLF